MRMVLSLWLLLGCLLSGFSFASAQPPAPKIPKDLEIELIDSSNDRYGYRYTYRIAADGKVSFDFFGIILPNGRRGAEPLNSRRDSPAGGRRKKLYERLSQEQLARFVDAFGTSGFFEMNDRYDSNSPRVKPPCLAHARSIGLSITANGRGKSVTFVLACDFADVPELKPFLEVFDLVANELKGVRMTETTK